MAASALVVAACSSGSQAVTAPSTLTVPAATPGSSTGPGPASGTALTPTVFDCGGGAYEPATLLIVCGVGSTMATGVKWSSWSGSAATGNGSVALAGHPAQPATLALASVVSTANGPQFSVLTVTWTGTSPDGHPTDTFHLATSPGGS